MQQSFLRETAGVLMRAVVVIGSIFAFFVIILTASEVDGEQISDGVCNVAVIPIEGAIAPFHGLADFDLITTPEKVELFMEQAEADDNILAVLAEINSPGGTPVASERIAERLRMSDLPVVGLAGDMAASGGYMIAAATDYLIASPMSDVGSIGVNMSYLENSKKNDEEGITYVQLTTGKFKDAGSPDRPLTDEERERFQGDLQIIHDHFVDLVAQYRKLDRDHVAALADGSAMPGVRAINEGLIDKLGGRTEAKQTLADLLGKTVEEIHFCEYEGNLLPF